MARHGAQCLGLAGGATMGGWRRPRSLKGEEQGVSMRFGIHEIARTTSPPSIASANVRLELHVLDHARSHR